MERLRDDEISVEELKRRLNANDPITIVDVREPFEYRICNIGGLLIPMGSLPSKLDALKSSDEIAVICHHGNRSRRAVDFLKNRGFERARNVVGGIEAWADRIDPTMARY